MANGQRSIVNATVSACASAVRGITISNQQSAITHQQLQMVNTPTPPFTSAPDRTPRPPLVCPLGPDELVRVAYNGRFSSPMGEWRYEHTIFNFILTERLAPEMFLAERVRQIEDLADLR